MPIRSAAILIDGMTVVVWIWVLNRSELGKIYPMMVLAFILAPVALYLAFGERFSTQYLPGVAPIAAGIMLTAKG